MINAQLFTESFINRQTDWATKLHSLSSKYRTAWFIEELSYVLHC